jgi:hypothetical protein
MRIIIVALVALALVTPLAFGEVYSNIVGLYKIDCGVGKNLVSMPFLPFNSTLDNVIGNQLTGHTFNKNLSDTIERWDPVAKVYQRAWYNTTQAKWLDWNTGGAPFNFNPDESYWITVLGSHTAKTVTLLGEVSETNRTIAIGAGRNMVSPSFPKEIALADSGLIASGFTGHSFNKNLSDRLEWWDRATASYFAVWYKTADSTFRNWGDGAVATRKINPGEGLWVVVASGHSAFSWVVPKPY